MLIETRSVVGVSVYTYPKHDVQHTAVALSAATVAMVITAGDHTLHCHDFAGDQPSSADPTRDILRGHHITIAEAPGDRGSNTSQDIALSRTHHFEIGADCTDEIHTTTTKTYLRMTMMGATLKRAITHRHPAGIIEATETGVVAMRMMMKTTTTMTTTSGMDMNLKKSKIVTMKSTTMIRMFMMTVAMGMEEAIGANSRRCLAMLVVRCSLRLLIFGR
jgi:hypothetical protein